jgi:hypothetical protein
VPTAKEFESSVPGGPHHLAIDEEAVRDWILRAYHERRGDDPREAKLADAVRGLLSGPPGGPSAGDYYFEKDPARSVPRFAADLDAVHADLAAAIFQPLLQAAEKRAIQPQAGAPSNTSVFLASLSGPIAVKAGLAETAVCAVLGAALLVLARLGSERLRGLLGEPRR